MTIGLMCAPRRLPTGDSAINAPVVPNRKPVINPIGGVSRCSEAGGGATLVTHPEPSNLEGHLMPSFLSDGRRFIYLRIVRSKPEQSGIYIGDLGSESAGQGKRLIATGFPARYVQRPSKDPASSCSRRMGRCSRNGSTKRS